MKITFLGHAALLVEDINFKALIDPYLTGNPLYKKNRYDIEGVTHIFITHGHRDHVGDALDIANANDALIISNAELASAFHQHDKELKLHPMHIGGSFTFPFGRVKMTPAVHGSSYQDEHGSHDGGNPGGFLITINGKTLYHAGDTGLIMDMQLLADEHVDVAFLPIGGNYTMDIKDAVKAVTFIKPKQVVPMHYNTFPLIKADPEEFRAKVKDATVVILQPRDSIKI